MHFIPMPRYLLLLLLALLVGGCASTRSVMEWRDDSFTSTIDSLLIIAATPDGALRRNAEDGFRARFESIGIRATSGYSVLDESAELSRETVTAALGDRQIDAVMITRLLGVEEIEEYQPPMHRYHYRGYPRYYSHAMTVTTPGYYRRFKLLTLETALYDSASGELLWSMQSETIEPEAPQDVIDEQIDLTLKRLQASGLLAIPAE